MSTMTDRFFRGRWSPTRKKIDAMHKGQSLTFPVKEYFNCKSSVERLNDAYAGEKVFTMTGGHTTQNVVSRIV